MPVIDKIRGFQEELTSIRHDLHMHPELGLEEHRTAEIVAKKLAEWGIEVHPGVGKTGVVGVLKRGSGGPAIGLRADMDCLPMDEQTNLTYRSKTVRQDARLWPRRPHHDASRCAAKYLATSRHLQRHRELHLPAGRGRHGRCAWRCWTMACSSAFPVTRSLECTTGPTCRLARSRSTRGLRRPAAHSSTSPSPDLGAHGARPEASIDPVLVASHITAALQSIVSRETCRRRIPPC